MTILQAFEVAVQHHRSGRLAEAESLYRQILAVEPRHAEALHHLGIIAHQVGQNDAAIELIRQAIAMTPTNPGFHSDLGMALLTAGKQDEGVACLWRAVGLQPDFLPAHQRLAHALLPGATYYDWLRCFHEWLRPRVYLEIGVESGASLALARPPTRAVGIDPAPMPTATFTAETSIFAMPSDHFFATENLVAVTGHAHIDLAFIDGLHHYDQVLRDFIHVEAWSRPSTVVLIHDCLPLDDLTAARDRRTAFWTGDTWKIIPILKRARPDLSFFTIATPPSGLAVVTGLDATSAVLSERFDEIVREQHDLTLLSMEDRDAALCVVANDREAVRTRLFSELGSRR